LNLYSAGSLEQNDRGKTCRSTMTHCPDSEPTSRLLFLPNAACLAKNQQIPKIIVCLDSIVSQINIYEMKWKTNTNNITLSDQFYNNTTLSDQFYNNTTLSDQFYNNTSLSDQFYNNTTLSDQFYNNTTLSDQFYNNTTLSDQFYNNTTLSDQFYNNTTLSDQFYNNTTLSDQFNKIIPHCQTSSTIDTPNTWQLTFLTLCRHFNKKWRVNLVVCAQTSYMCIKTIVESYIQYNLVKPPPSVQPDFGVITSLAINWVRTENRKSTVWF
jgi:hypothetical protein